MGSICAIFSRFFGRLCAGLLYNKASDRRNDNNPLRQKGVPDKLVIYEEKKKSGTYGAERNISLCSSANMELAEKLISEKVPMLQAYDPNTLMEDDKYHTVYSSDDETNDTLFRLMRDKHGILITDDLHFVEIFEMPSSSNANVTFVYYQIFDESNDSQFVNVDNDGERLLVDLSRCRWIQDLTRNEKIKLITDYISDEDDIYGVEITFKFAWKLAVALQRFRDVEVATISSVQELPLFSSCESLAARVMQICCSNNTDPTLILGKPLESVFGNLIVPKIIGQSPADREIFLRQMAQFGELAHNYHQRLKQLALLFVRVGNNPVTVEMLVDEIRRPPNFEFYKTDRDTKAVAKKADDDWSWLPELAYTNASAQPSALRQALYVDNLRKLFRDTHSNKYVIEIDKYRENVSYVYFKTLLWMNLEVFIAKYTNGYMVCEFFKGNFDRNQLVVGDCASPKLKMLSILWDHASSPHAIDNKEDNQAQLEHKAGPSPNISS